MQTEFAFLGLVFVLLSSVAWGVLDGFRKKLGAYASAADVAGGVCAFQVPILLFFLPTQDLVLQSDYVLFGLGSIFLNVVSGYLFIRSLQLSPLSQTIPFLSFTPVFTALSGFVFLGESLVSQGLLGIAFVVAGAILLGVKGEGVKLEKGSILMILVALIWSLTPVLDKKAVATSSTFVHTLLLALGIAISFGLISARQNRKLMAFPNALFRHWKLFLIAGFLNLVAVYAQFESFAYFPISYVETLKRAIGIILAFGIGIYLFSEKVRLRDSFAAILMIIGSALIIFSN